MATRNGAQPNQPTLVPQAAANAAGMIQNPAYRANNINDYGPFDTLPFVRNLASYGFFTQGVGSNGKTQFDTNMVTGSQFPLGRNVVVKAIGFHFIFAGGSTPANRAAQIQALYDVLEGSTIEFVIQGRQFEFQAPGSFWLPEVAMAQLYTASSTDGSVTGAYQRMGDYFREGGYMMSIPITLQNLVPWQMNWNVNLQDPKVAAALAVLTPDNQTPAKLRWQFKATLEQGT